MNTDIDNTREKLVINGYVHPTSTNYNRDKRYKTFDDTDKKKKASMDRFHGTNAGSQYSTYTSTQDEAIDNCPVCEELPVRTCPCAYSDKSCANNHTWHTDRDGKNIIGDPHKK